MKNLHINRPVFSANNCAVLSLDEHGNIKDWNNNAEKLKGYSRTEVLTKHFSIFFTKEDQRNHIPEQLLAEAAQNGSAVFNGFRVRKDGTQFWANTTVVAHFGTNGVLTGFTKVVKDTTEISDHFEFTQSNTNALINNLSGIMWSVDREYNLITANKAFDAMVEYMSGKRIPLGGEVFNGFSDIQVRKFKEYYNRAFKGETFSVIDYLNEPFERWSEISFSPISQHYKVIGVACYSHDITTLKKAESKLIAANRLYSFLSKINHAVVRVKDMQSLYEEVCRIAIESGGFKTAWISNIDARSRIINLVSQSGMAVEDLSAFNNIKIADYGPQDHVLTTGDYYVCNNVKQGFELPGWQQWGLERGIHALIILPIKREGRIVGTFNLYASENDFFDKKEIELLEQAASDISFALDVFDKEENRLIAETKLIHSETRLLQAQQLGNLGSWEMNFSTGMATWSAQHCRIYGIPLTDNIHSLESWMSFIHPADAERVLKETQGATEQARNYSFCYRIIRPDSTIRHLQSNNYFDLDGTGKVVGLYGTALDITEMKIAEENLKYNEFRLKQAQECAHFGSWTLDFTTGSAEWSEEACRIYGVPTDNGRYTYEQWLSFIHPDDLPHVLNIAAIGQSNLSNSDFYHRIIRPDGAIRHIHSQTNFEFDDTGKPIGLYGVAHDVTEEKNNLARIQAQNEQLRQIAWVQSHKVRGPLATIIGLAQLFKNKTAPQENDLIMDGIVESADKLDRVIAEIVGNTRLS
jgi:PAS domain S-box-containing protein